MQAVCAYHLSIEASCGTAAMVYLLGCYWRVEATLRVILNPVMLGFVIIILAV